MKRILLPVTALACLAVGCSQRKTAALKEPAPAPSRFADAKAFDIYPQADGRAYATDENGAVWLLSGATAERVHEIDWNKNALQLPPKVLPGGWNFARYERTQTILKAQQRTKNEEERDAQIDYASRDVP